MKALPEMYATPIKTLADGVHLAGISGLDRTTLWDEPPGGRPVIETGYELDERTTAVGQYGAHLVRLAHGGPGAPPWVDVLRRAGAELNSTDVNDRRVIAAELRWQIMKHPEGVNDEPGRDVAKILDADGGRQLMVTTGHLARRINSRIDAYRPYLGAAWYSVHGLDLLDRLAAAYITVTTGEDAAAGGQPGRPPAQASEVRALQRRAAVGVWSTKLLGKSALAERLRVSRPTLDSWLPGPDARARGGAR